MNEIEKAIKALDYFRKIDFGGLLKAEELLQEKAEREKGWSYCNNFINDYRMDKKGFTVKFESISELTEFNEFKRNNYCPMCGRKLSENDG